MHTYSIMYVDVNRPPLHTTRRLVNLVATVLP